MNKATTNGAGHPLDPYLRAERMPHIWCSGCGLGLVVNCFLRGLIQSRLALDKVVVVSGIGCAGRAAGYINLDSFHTTHGRAIPFATGLKLSNPELKVVVISGDGDLTAIGGNHLIHAARRNVDITVLCINNFIYGMTGGQVGPTTPLTARTTTSVGGNIDQPFNIPYLAAASGAAYVARWTTAQVIRLQKSITEALLKNGFSLIEIITPCPTYYGRMNKQRTGLEQMKYYRDNSIVKSGIDPKHAGIEFNGPIIVGRFVD
ncbi:MAG: thiamine pyrophosphate-dependent enzyme [Dehalococcoidales bacterium]|nr:thiamine pyrophosphate-dependent enzyme [Dehalococcoidales bacterium]